MFLTLEDPRAAIKGSRDPLGLVPIWSAFGRDVVTNLTTQTTDLRGFTTYLLARYLTKELIDSGEAGEEDALSIFLRFEQIAGYARHIVHKVEGNIRGIERIKRFTAEGGAHVKIGDTDSHMILSDQKVYGLWGLYTVAARTSGLLADGITGLTQYASEFVHAEYHQRLKTIDKPIKKLIMNGGRLATRNTDKLLKTVASMLNPIYTSDEKAFYARTIRDALEGREGEVSITERHRQATLAALLQEHTDLDKPLTHEEMRSLIEHAADKDEGLAQLLRRIGNRSRPCG